MSDIDYSKHYLRVNDETDDGIKKLLRHYEFLLKDCLPKDKNAKILDVGCGRGYLLLALKNMGYHNVYGIDISKGQIDGCKRLDVPAEYVTSSEKYLCSHTNEYDCIITFDVLEHIETDKTINFVRCIYNSLKGDGIFITKVPNANNVISSRWRYIDWTHQVSFTEHSLDFVLSSGGFENNIIIEEKFEKYEKASLKSLVWQIIVKLYRAFIRSIYYIEFLKDAKNIPLTLNIMSISKK